MRRTSARVLAVIATVLVGALALVDGMPASALENESMTVPARATTEADYPPIPANDPGTVTVDHTLVGPDECRDLPSCALVPIDIEVPELDPGDDFYVVLTISWEVTDISDNNVQPVKSNDLDCFLYDNKQKAEQEGGSGYTEIGSSASGDMPEVIKAFEPLYGRYNLVVVNFAGGNTGWHLKAESIVGEFDKPFESLAPGPQGGSVNPRNKPATTTTTPPAGAATTTTATVPEGVIIPDDDFDGEAFAPGADPLGDELQDQLDNAAQFGELGERASAESPSPLTVIGWMVVFPVALAGGGWFVFTRTRRRRTTSPQAG